MQLDALVRPLAGGMLIGLSASLLLIGLGRIAGISGIVGDLWFDERHDRSWRAWFLVGLLGGAALVEALWPGSIQPSPRPWLALVLAGVLVGVGTRVGAGCTSGHGICGISRLSKRAFYATATFMCTGMLTVAITRGLGLLGAR